jgi:tape measure domain-containing protein
MSSIDERIVSIKFNNAQFEAGIKTTMSSLDGLKKSLNFEAGIKGLNDLDAAGRKITPPKFDGTAFNNGVQTTITATNKLKDNLKFDGAVKGLNDLDAAGKKVNLKLDPTGFQMGAKGVIDSANAIKQNLNFESVSRGFGTLKTNISSLSFEQVVNGSRNAAKAIADLDLAGKAVNFAHIQNSAGQAQTSISAMSVAGVAALGALAFKAATVGAEMAKSLFLDPAKSGLAEYETNLGSIQTIMANTQWENKSLGDVNGALDELNEYSDKTIYNFAEMAKNIGTFTSAGVKLDDSTQAIKGIANLAAISGSNSQQASTAMYQLSQAMSAGKVGLEDWNSVVNAGMGGKVFQDALIQTAKNQGQNVDGLIAKHGSFRMSLQEGWITSKVMTETLAKMTGDLTDDQLRAMGYNNEQIVQIQEMAKTAQDAATKIKTFTQLTGTLTEITGSGWAQSWKLILGDFEQAKEMWTNVYKVIGGMVQGAADARNKMLGDWNAAGGRTEMIGAVSAAFKVLMGVLTPVQEAFREVFPPMTGQRLFEITKAIRVFIEALIPGQEQTSLLKNSFKLLFTIIKFGLDIISGAIGVVVAFFRAFATGGESLNGSLKPLTDALGQMADRIKNSTFVQEFFANLTKVATQLGTALGRVIPIIVRMSQYVADTATLIWLSTGYYLQMFTAFMADQLIPIISDGIDIFFNIIDAILDFAEAIPKAAQAFAKGGLEAAINVFKDSMGALGDVGAAVMTRITERVESIKRFADRLAQAWEQVSAAMARMWDKLLPLREAVHSLFSDLAEKLKAVFTDVNYDDTLDMINTGLLAGLVLLFKSTFKKMLGMGDGVKDSLMESLTTSVEGINDVLEALTGTLGAMQQNLQADTLMKIAIAIGILAISVVALSLIDSAALTKSLVAIGVMVAILTKAMEALDKITVGSGFLKLPFIAASMILLATALAILVIPVTQLSQLSWGELIKGLTGTLALMWGLTKAAEAMSKNPQDLIRTGIGLIAVAIAIKVLASALKDVAELSFGDMIQGLIGVGALLAGLSIFTNMTKVNEGSLANMAGMILLGIALKIMASALADFAGMDIGGMIQGLATMAIVLALLQRFTITVNGADVLKTAFAMGVLAVSLKIMASAMADFAGFSWEEIAKGLLVMSFALKAMSTALARVPQNMLSSAVGFIAIAAALKILASALKDFASMSWEEIGKAMAVLIPSLIMLSVAMIAMTGTLSGAAALLVVSVALVALAQALTMFGNLSWEQLLHGLAALAAVFVIFGLAGLVLGPIVPVLFSLGVAIGMLGLGLMGIGLGTALFAAGLVVIATAVAVAGPILIAFVASILALIPMAMMELGKGIVAFADVIGGAMPTFLNAFVALLQTLLTAIQMVFPQLMDTLWMVIVGLVDLVVRGIPLFVDAGMKIIIGIVEGIGNNIGQMVDAGAKVITEWLNGISRNMPQVTEAGVNLIITFIESMATSVRNNSQRMADAGADLAGSIIEGMANGVATMAGRVLGAIGKVAEDAIAEAARVLNINSPSKEFIAIGKSIDEGWSKGIDKNADMVTGAVAGVGGAAIKVLKKTMSSMALKSAGELDINPTIRPVLDLSAIKRDGAQIGSMLGTPELALSGTYDKATALAASDRVRRETLYGTNAEAVTSAKGDTYMYTQNITSPKAVNEAEIYRRNKNLISTVRKGEPVAG